MVAQSAHQFTSTPSSTVTNSSTVGTEQQGIKLIDLYLRDSNYD